ncbi:MAG: DoxX family membrane protein [Bacteroidetes bacterium]|nr:DoxX family membrane protein [Bacteroidota bacterium]
MSSTSFLLLRLAVGTSALGHGLVRVPKLRVFSQWMGDTFAKSMLPRSMVALFGLLLPIVELILGVLLISGLFTLPALIAGSFEMIFLVFGCCMIENWEPIASQLIHLIIYVVLIQFLSNNWMALDNLI